MNMQNCYYYLNKFLLVKLPKYFFTSCFMINSLAMSVRFIAESVSTKCVNILRYTVMCESVTDCICAIFRFAVNLIVMC